MPKAKNEHGLNMFFFCLTKLKPKETKIFFLADGNVIRKTDKGKLNFDFLGGDVIRQD